jgi:hypothetical protein
VIISVAGEQGAAGDEPGGGAGTMRMHERAITAEETSGSFRGLGGNEQDQQAKDNNGGEHGPEDTRSHGPTVN